MEPISEALRELLARQDMRGVGLQSGRAKGLASAPVSGEEDRKRRHSPTAGEGYQPMRMNNAGADTPAKVEGVETHQEPSPERHTRPVLKLIVGSGRRGSRTHRPPRLTLVQ